MVQLRGKPCHESLFENWSGQTLRKDWAMSGAGAQAMRRIVEAEPVDSVSFACNPKTSRNPLGTGPAADQFSNSL
jgi:hypothetical protein